MSEIVIEDPRGFPDTIGNDLARENAKHADACQINYDEGRDVVTVYWEHDMAGKWLYDWLEETAQYYKENFVDASGEYDAAKQIAKAVYDRMSGSERGLCDKYTVHKDGEPVADCFVLEPAGDPAAVVALKTYARETDDYQLATDLADWIAELEDSSKEDNHE